MAERDLTIRMRMETSAAKAADREFVAAHKRNVREMTALDADAESLRLELFGGSHAALRSLSAKSEAAHKSMSDRGVAGTMAMAASTALFTVGLQQALNIARLMGDTLNKAGERSRDLASKFSGQREDLGELAGLMGRKADTAFTLDMAKFNAATGFTPTEGRGFLSALYDAGAQYRGTDRALGQTMAGSEFDQYSRQLGRLALSMDLDPKQVATMGGAILGQTDFNKFGPLAAETAIGRVHRAMKIMGAGQGETSDMVKQYKMLSAAAFSEKDLVGLFHDPDDVAIAASLMAQKNPLDSALAAQSAGRGLRKNTPRAAAFREQMGITLGTPFLEAMEIMGLAPKGGGLSKIEQAAKDLGGGATTTDVFTRAGFSIQEARALAVGTQHAGIIPQRRDVAARYPGFKASLDFIDESMTGDRMMMRRRQAETALAETERGAENDRLSILREEARGNLVRAKRDVPGLMDAAGNALPFSMAGERAQLMIDEEAQAILRRRGGDAGSMADMFNVTPIAREADLRGQMERLQGRGVDPLTGGKFDPANAEMLKIEKERRRDEKNAPGAVLGARPTDRFVNLPR